MFLKYKTRTLLFTIQAFPDVDSASLISLGEGNELADMDFHLRKVHAITVRGRLAGAVEKLSASQIQVVLAHNENGVASYIDRVPGVVDTNTGRFEIRGVSPGSYFIVASELSNQPSGGRIPIEISPTAVPEQASVPLSYAFDILGTVELEGAPRGSMANLIVRLQPAEGLTLGPQPWRDRKSVV